MRLGRGQRYLRQHRAIGQGHEAPPRIFGQGVQLLDGHLPLAARRPESRPRSEDHERHRRVRGVHRDARELAAVFQGKAPGHVYGRQGNPTSSALEVKVNRMEDGVATISFATGPVIGDASLV